MANFDLARQAFGPIQAEPERNGGQVLTRLFKEHPDTQKLFPRFKSIPQGDLASNDAVAKHGAVVVNKLGELLSLGGNHGAVLEPLAKTHATEHKIKLNNFNLITEVFLKMMEEKGVDANARESFKKVMGVIIDEMAVLYKGHHFDG